MSPALIKRGAVELAPSPPRRFDDTIAIDVGAHYRRLDVAAAISALKEIGAMSSRSAIATPKNAVLIGCRIDARRV